MAIGFAAAGAHAQQAQPPRFQTSVDVTPIDVSVVDDRGRPIQDLKPGDFTVKIDNNVRRVVTAEWVPLMTEAKASAAVVLPEGYTSNENAGGGRLIILVVDEPNIRFGGNRGVVQAANTFIDKLSASDRLAAVGLSPTSPATPFTADRKIVKDALLRMAGQRRGSSNMMQYNVAVSEAIAIHNGDRLMADSVFVRECRQERTPQAIEQCRQTVEAEAMMLAQETQQNSDLTMRGLRDVLTAMKAIEGPKTMIVMSEGFVVDNTSLQVIELGDMAAAARTSLYALQLDDNLFDVTEARRPTAPSEDRRARSEGLEILAGASRGTLFNVAAGAGTVFDRIDAELSGYYLLGVESDPRDRDGRPHPVKVEVPRRGAFVRARRQFINASAAESRSRSPREAVAAALSAPLILSSLPLRVATFSLQGPDAAKIQLLIHADVGNDYTGPKRLSLGYVISDATGRIVEQQTADARLAPPMNGVPSALEYTIGASLAPGEYSLKLAIADGDRLGTIEHPIHAALVEAGPVKLSELMVGGPVDPTDRFRPTVGYTVSYGSVHGYLEAYGADPSSVKVKYEIATDDRAPAIVSVDVAARPSGDRRALFTQMIPLRSMPPGKYRLRAIVSKGGVSVKTLSRPFEVAAPAVLMTSASGSADAPSTDGELFLPIDETAIGTPFSRDEALKASTLEPFRAKLADVTPEGKAAFDKALGFMANKEWTKAEASLKLAIKPENDSTAALAYLAVCFAASGHDTEAASAWQTALVDGSDIPQIYQWLGDALLRTRDMSAARSIFEEALGKWPSDARFTRPAAMLYATFGKGREAVRTLERYIGDGHQEPDTLALAIEWLYHVRSAGGVVHTRAEDVKLARAYADEYAKTNGPKQQLVKQWIEFIEQK